MVKAFTKYFFILKFKKRNKKCSTDGNVFFLNIDYRNDFLHLLYTININMFTYNLYFIIILC